MEMPIFYYNKLCPNCREVNTNERLEDGLPCDKCLPKRYKNIANNPELIYKHLSEIKDYKIIYEKHEKEKQFTKFFKELFGFEPWSIQKNWFLRLENGESFSIVAPTGVGKTTFLIGYSIYKKKRTLFIVPTSVLAKQIYERYTKVSKDLVVLYYHSKMKKKEREEFEKRLSNKNYDVLIITPQFLTKKYELLLNQDYSYIFIDDVDAFLKSSRNLDKLFMICGLSKEKIKESYELLLNFIKKKISFEDIEEFQKSLPKLPQIVIASATGSMRGLKPRLFRILFNFDIGYSRANIRNITNVNCGKLNLETIKKIVKSLGKVGILYTHLKEEAKAMEEELNKIGISAKFEEDSDKIIKYIEDEEYEIIIGVSSYYGKLVRGLDFPEKIKYVIFTDLPHFKFKLDKETILNLKSPGPLMYIFSILSKQNSEYLKYLSQLRRNKYNLEEIWNVIEENLNLLKSLDTYQDGYLLIPDFKTYVQGSGRCSRAVNGGLTKGYVFLFWNNENLYKKYESYIRGFLEEEIINFEDLDLNIAKEEIETSREILKEVRNELTKSVLFIVESPTKAKTIAKFFGKPAKRQIGELMAYETTSGKYIITVVASIGHIFDLITKAPVDKEELFGVVNYKYPYFTPILKCIDCGTQQTTTEGVCRICGSKNLKSSFSRILSLQKLALENDIVLIGTDPDTEGEKIAYDIYVALKPFCKDIYRVEFHEVTKKAILKALDSRNEINKNRVLAQVVRRIEDRWIGFALSQKLQKEFNNYNLSAGRVQTPVLKWIIDRYLESRQSITTFCSLYLENGSNVVFKDYKKCSGEFIEYEIIEKWEEVIKPKPPYTTDAILVDAQEKLKLSPAQTMQILQDLFYNGLCTYHRTDSTHVSSAGIEIAKLYLEDKKLELKPRSWGEEGTHECIRPTRPLDVGDLINYVASGEIVLYSKFTSNHYKVYNLLFKRFIASQMPEAKVKKAKVKWKYGDNEIETEEIVEIIDKGFLEVLPIKVVEFGDKKGKISIKSKYEWKGPTIPLYTEGDIVRKMKTEEIGRPSTYATILQKLFKRYYVIKSKKSGKLIPTKQGIEICEYLFNNYGNLVSVERTRELEKKMDLIEEKPDLYYEVLKELKNEIKEVLE